MVVPANGWFRDAETGGIVIASSPFISCLPFLITLLFFIPGVAYGFTAGAFKKSDDLVNALGDAVGDMGPFVALCFVMAQFLKYFDWSKLSTILAIKGAELLSNSGLSNLAILIPVSYTHLDVYKRQAYHHAALSGDDPDCLADRPLQGRNHRRAVSYTHLHRRHHPPRLLPLCLRAHPCPDGKGAGPQR